MAQAPTAEQDAWVGRVLDLDAKELRGGGAGPESRRTGVRKAATDLGNTVGDVVSEVKIGAEKVQQGVLGVGDTVVDTGKQGVQKIKAVVGWGPPATALPVGPVNLTSQTEATAPANRARIRLGVGERVVLTVTGGPGNWTVSGAKINATTGTTVTMTAPVRPGSAKVEVDVGGTKRSLQFTVIAPSEVHMVVTATEHYDNSYPNAGMHCGVYIGPDDVNFGETTNSEDDIRAKGDGYWSEFSGNGHQPSAAPNDCDPAVVQAGLGTHSPGDDHVWSGYIVEVPPNGDWSGTLTYDIPWHWQCGSGAGLIGRILHSQVTDAAGATTISKAGASYAAALSP